MVDWGAYVGKPFSWEGYGPDSYFCWSLVVDVYRREFGITLPREVDREAPPGLSWIESIGFRRVDRPREGDVIHMRGFSNGRVNALHCGVAVDKRQVLHAEESTGSIVTRIHDDRFFKRFLGAYRHKEMSDD